MGDAVFDLELNLESLSLCGVLPGDSGLSYLWRNCKNVKKLLLKSCESVGDYSSFSCFSKFLSGLKELELRTCRSIFNGVLLILAENCVSLDSLLVYDGGSREGLLQFINQCKCSLRRLDLRLPLDLDNSHLIAISENLNFRGLVSLRLQSCCLVTGEGLKVLARAIGNVLQELALVNCDVLERESGLLAALGQDLKRLRKLDLSYNDMLLDKELVSMLISSVDSMVRSCKQLESVDITYCCGIEVEGVEALVLNSLRLRRLEVDQSKLSEVARTWTADKLIEVVY
ncbi:UNVERIFIED_CONTAM: hypothetical protein Scaly_0019700 [Sesamum calycinum]|uniref:Uncharacterized protein n=1 Tax=Sesamum calycinum TaxID=2727403 RepID=A0AAW2STJ2_9LAMI